MRLWWVVGMALVAIAISGRPMSAAQDDREIWLEVLTRTEAYYDDGSLQGFLGAGLSFRIVDYSADDEGAVWVAVRHPSGATVWVVFDERVRQVLEPLARPEPQPATSATPERIVSAPEAAPPVPTIAPEPPLARPTEVAPAVPGGPITPLPPTNLIGAYDSGNRSMTLRWTDLSNNEQGFMIEVQTVSGASVTAQAVGANATSTTVSGLSPNTRYCYYVSAYNEAGSSDRAGICDSQGPSAAPCPMPSSDSLLFTYEVLSSGTDNTTTVNGGVTNNASWSVSGLTVTVGTFGLARMARTELGPGQSTTWQLRVGGLYTDVPSQLGFNWVPPATCR